MIKMFGAITLIPVLFLSCYWLFQDKNIEGILGLILVTLGLIHLKVDDIEEKL